MAIKLQIYQTIKILKNEMHKYHNNCSFWIDFVLPIYNRSNRDKKTQYFIYFVDDFRPKINSYGESNMITPNIDKLASEGLQFNNAFTNIAVCGASRASIMTGIRPSQDL